MNAKRLSDQKISVRVFTILFIFLTTYVIFRKIYEEPAVHLPLNLRKYIIYDEIKNINKAYNVTALRYLTKKYNIDQSLRNADKFEPVGVDTAVMVIQVHKDIKRLQYLIVSLAQVQGIHTSLLVFSHSFYHPTINRLINSIDFCKFTQIFYPHSLQLNPQSFPGEDPDDCSYSGQLNCVMRNAQLTEHKQHWWWKANFVFTHIKFSRNFNNPIIFLEEFNYVAPDLLHIYPYMQRSFNYFPFIQVLSFGRPLTKNNNWDLLTVESWRPPFDVGLAFNRTTWLKILSFSDKFCMYNDNSWSYSMWQLFRNFPEGHVDMAASMNPRVISTKTFKNTEDAIKISKYYEAQHLFPEKLKAVVLYGPNGKVERVVKEPPFSNGGWNDLRDQLLCLDPLMITTTEEPRYDLPTFEK